METNSENKEVISEKMVSVRLVQACINAVFSNFVKEESGNRVTSFSMQGLANVLLTTINDPSRLQEKPQDRKEPTSPDKR